MINATGAPAISKNCLRDDGFVFLEPACLRNWLSKPARKLSPFLCFGYDPPTEESLGRHLADWSRKEWWQILAPVGPALATPPRLWFNVSSRRRPPSLLRSTRLLIAGRALANMTQTDLASAAGIAVSVLQAIEQGKSDPKLSTVIALLDALKAQGVELLPGSDNVAWGVYVVAGSPAAAGGVPEPEIAPPPQRKRRGRPPKSAAA